MTFRKNGYPTKDVKKKKRLQIIDKNILLPFLPAEHITDTFLCQQPSSPAHPRLGERCRFIA